eukprot:915171-Rhodomonas_salina.2
MGDRRESQEGLNSFYSFNYDDPNSAVPQPRLLLAISSIVQVLSHERELSFRGWVASISYPTFLAESCVKCWLRMHGAKRTDITFVATANCSSLCFN